MRRSTMELGLWFTRRGGWLLAALLAAPLSAQEGADIVGAEDQNQGCITCHALEVEAWQQSRHFATFQDRHRSPEAKQILDALGLRSMKRAEECNQCHYTSQERAGRLSAISGVSCESCHGAARTWVDLHQKAGGDPAAEAIKWGTGKDEPPARRRARLEAAAAKGMLHPARLDEIARNCYGCHTVPNEKVVNTGGHKAGSDFELVSWSQGEVRHNFTSSSGAPDKPTNRPASAAERRRLYVVGALVDLETSLRNLGSAREPGGAFAQAMAKRATAARARVAGIVAKADLPGVASALSSVPETIDAGAASAADAVARAAREFSASADGAALASLDALIPAKAIGTPHKE